MTMDDDVAMLATKREPTPDDTNTRTNGNVKYIEMQNLKLI